MLLQNTIKGGVSTTSSTSSHAHSPRVAFRDGLSADSASTSRARTRSNNESTRNVLRGLGMTMQSRLNLVAGASAGSINYQDSLLGDGRDDHYQLRERPLMRWNVGHSMFDAAAAVEEQSRTSVSSPGVGSVVGSDVVQRQRNFSRGTARGSMLGGFFGSSSSSGIGITPASSVGPRVDESESALRKSEPVYSVGMWPPDADGELPSASTHAATTRGRSSHHGVRTSAMLEARKRVARFARDVDRTGGLAKSREVEMASIESGSSDSEAEHAHANTAKAVRRVDESVSPLGIAGNTRGPLARKHMIASLSFKASLGGGDSRQGPTQLPPIQQVSPSSDRRFDRRDGEASDVLPLPMDPWSRAILESQGKWLGRLRVPALGDASCTLSVLVDSLSGGQLILSASKVKGNPALLCINIVEAPNWLQPSPVRVSEYGRSRSRAGGL